MGRRGRGRGRSSYNRNRYNRSNDKRSKQPEMKFFPHAVGRQQAVTYDTVKDHIIINIQKSFQGGDDIAESLRDMKVIDLEKEKPVRQLSENKDANERKIEQDGYDIVYSGEIQSYIERTRLLRQNLKKAYAHIITYCSPTIKNRIETHVDYVDKIRDDPISLLRTINVLMHDPVRAKYPYASLTEVMSRLVTMKQYENENLLEYTKRFKQAKEIMKSHVGD